MYVALLISVFIVSIFVFVLTCNSLAVEVVFHRCSHNKKSENEEFFMKHYLVYVC